MRHVVVVAAVLSALLAAVPAAAAPARIDFVAVVEGAPGFAVAAWDGGLMLVRPTGEVHSVYRYARVPEGSPDRVRVEDIDADGRAEVIGIGRPTFLLNDKGNPLLDFEGGCIGFALGDLHGEEAGKKELVCLQQSSVDVYTHDAQFLWRADLKRLKLYELGVGDTDDSGWDDVEFRVKKDKFVWRWSEDGEEMGRDFTERATTVQATMADAQQASADLIAGKTAVDLNGDGTAEERITVNRAVVAFTSGGKGKPIGELAMPGAQVVSAAVGDLDGDGTSEVVLGGVGHLVIATHDATIKAELKIDPARMKREPVATLSGANAVGLEEQEDTDALKKTLEGHFASVAACYGKRLQAYPLTHRGKVILKFPVDKKGRVGKHELLYTDIDRPEMLRCIGKAARKWKVPKAVSDGAHLILDMELGWKDTL